MNLFYSSNDNMLMAIVKEGKSESKVITQYGDIKDVPNYNLEPVNSLISGGLYDKNFIQAVIGGLEGIPTSKAGLILLPGRYVKAYVQEEDGMYRYAIGIPNEAFPEEAAEKLDKMKINKDKSPDFEGFDIEEPKLDVKKKEEEKEGEEETPGEIRIDDSQPIEGTKKLTLQWDDLKDEISIEDIKDMFGSDALLPEPDVIKIDTGEEVITRKKSKLNRKIKKAETLNPDSILTQVCPKCGTKLLMDTEESRYGSIVVFCPNCGYKSRYETEDIKDISMKEMFGE